MRPNGYLTLILAAIFCLGTFLPQEMRALGQPLSGSSPRDWARAAADFSSGDTLPHRSSGAATELSSNVAELPTADRRDLDAGRISLLRLSQLPRALCDAAADAGSTTSGWRCISCGRLPDDDRPHFSHTLVIEHVRLQI